MELVLLFILYLLGFKCMTEDWENDGNGYTGISIILISVVAFLYLATKLN